MPQTLTFAKVFTAEGEKNGKAWKRWDFKTAEGERYVTFNAGLANKIQTNTPVTVEIEGDNKIASIIGSAPAGNQQAASGSGGGPASPQGAAQSVTAPSGRDEARGKSKFGFWAALLPAMYSSLPKAEQTVEAAAQLVDHAMGEVFPEDVPF